MLYLHIGKVYKSLSLIFLIVMLSLSTYSFSQTGSETKIIFIRHGEKPEKGGNLTCKGLNRALLLPAVIKNKFGIPDYTYVPTLKMADKTSHARMFETVVPLAVRYNLIINSKFDEKDKSGIATEIKGEKGTILVVWEHSMIADIVHELGITSELNWPGDDYNSIWIVTFNNGKPTLTKDNEGVNPSDECPDK
jgi:hypothetical protein